MIRAIDHLSEGGEVVTDCKVVRNGWGTIRSAQGLPATLAGSFDADLWQQLAQGLDRRRDVKCHWMPSHKSWDEARAQGVCQLWYDGNVVADQVAKTFSKEGRAPADFVQQHLDLVLFKALLTCMTLTRATTMKLLNGTN